MQLQLPDLLYHGFNWLGRLKVLTLPYGFRETVLDWVFQTWANKIWHSHAQYLSRFHNSVQWTATPLHAMAYRLLWQLWSTRPWNNCWSLDIDRRRPNFAQWKLLHFRQWIIGRRKRIIPCQMDQNFKGLDMTHIRLRWNLSSTNNNLFKSYDTSKLVW